MSYYGIRVGNFDSSYPAFSVVQSGILNGTTTVLKGDHPDFKLWNVFFVPLGVRDTSRNELRPTTNNYNSAYSYIDRIIMYPPSNSSNSYIYFVLGR